MCLGEYDLTEQERWPNDRAEIPIDGDNPDVHEIVEHARTAVGSTESGGALSYMINTPEGSSFYNAIRK